MLKEPGLINHVHISEPFLVPVKQRKIHRLLKSLLEAAGYSGYVSIEMAACSDLQLVYSAIDYVRGIFHGS